MIKEAIEHIEKLKRQTLVFSKEAGKVFILNSEGGYDEVDTKELLPDMMEMSTLEGLVTFLNEGCNPKVVSAEKVTIYVQSSRIIEVSSRVHNKDMKIATLARVSAKINRCEFNFDEYYDVEEFRIAVATNFTNNQDKDSLLNSVSKIDASEIKTSEDDGVSQEVKTKSGIARKETVTLPKYLSLAPFRSFPDIEPVEQDYLFRVRKRGDDIQCALFETGSIVAEVEMCKRIKEWLSESLPGWVIIE